MLPDYILIPLTFLALAVLIAIPSFIGWYLMKFICDVVVAFAQPARNERDADSA